jgi:hypothetical protein
MNVMNKLIALLEIIVSILISHVDISPGEKTKLIVRLKELKDAISQLGKE